MNKQKLPEKWDREYSKVLNNLYEKLHGDDSDIASALRATISFVKVL